MAIGADFEDAFALRLKVRAQARRIDELEPGGACAEPRARMLSMRRGYEARAKGLQRELRAQERAAAKMRKSWFEVFEQVERERDEAVSHAMTSVSGMGERALRAERQRDALAGELTAERRRGRGKDVRIAELEGQAARLTAQANRDFENSSLPSSAQGPARKRIPNTRKPTGRRPGAQPGHPHHPRRRPEPTRVVGLPDPPGAARDPDPCDTGNATSRIVVSARVVVEATGYVAPVWRRRSNGARVHAPFPGGAACEASYDGSVKALACMLTHECGASIGKARRLPLEASGGELDLPGGMALGLARGFSLKGRPERDAAVAALMSAPVMHAGLASANVGGGGRQVLMLADPGAVAMVARGSKGHAGVKGTPLERYAGCAVHDHDTTFCPYGTLHQECMQHNVRHLVGSCQNEPRLTWDARMLGLVREMPRWRRPLGPGGGRPGPTSWRGPPPHSGGATTGSWTWPRPSTGTARRPITAGTATTCTGGCAGTGTASSGSSRTPRSSPTTRCASGWRACSSASNARPSYSGASGRWATRARWSRR